MSFEFANIKSLVRAPFSPVRVISFSFAICFLPMVVSGNAAWSFERTAASALSAPSGHLIQDVSYVQKVPSSSVADSCLPLLTSSHESPSSSATDRNQRTAGKVAALSMAFGVRFALGPLENPAFKHEAESAGEVLSLNGQGQRDRHAMKVAAYRNCQKEQALQAQLNTRKSAQSGS
ncbi:MAG: hypothetical protein KDI13_05915 [Alphaproteobacteria bacterium]|nr:hypothetical protein [Alphaproteobacteria bacterium]